MNIANTKIDITKLRFRKINHSKISIEPLYFKTFREVIGTLKNPIFDQQFEKKHGSLLNDTIVFGFKIGYENSFWEIRRTLKQFYELDKNIKHFDKDNKIKRIAILPKEKEDLNKTLSHLTMYLKLQCYCIKFPDCMLNFLEISCIDLPLKFKECYMLKHAGGRQNNVSISIFKSIEQKLAMWKKRYFIITQQLLLYLYGHDEQNFFIKESLNFDPTFYFMYGKKDTGKNNQIIVFFQQRKLFIKAENIFTFIDFIFALQSVVKSSPYTKIHRFGSFSPIRMSSCQWYVDGKDYFSDIFDAILKAKQTIFITDWWMSPELYLKRPINQFNEQSQQLRLMSLLRQVANNGVVVLILLYNSYNLVLYNNPKHCKKVLESMSPNIKVVRHPGKFPLIKFSHHEKMVVIYQTVAFMGGLDLCYGRWDDSKHILFDPDPQNPLFPEIDFSNSRIRDFVDVQKYQNTLLKENEPRMPWHDIAIQIQGDSVIDLSRHFVQYWNHSVEGKKYKTLIGLLQANDLEIRNYEQNKNQVNNQNNSNSNKTFENNIQQFLNINQLKNNQQYLEIRPVEQSEESEQESFEEKSKISKKNQKPEQIQQSQVQIIQNLEYFLTDLTQYQNQPFSCITQLTRSSSKWSTGIKYTELSIQNAYLTLISQAKQFIYIENQFFISKSADEFVKNSISSALVERIKRAHFEKQKFKVVVFLPLLPGFEGEIDQDNSTLLKIQIHYEYLTISRGGNSIIEQLTQAGINPSDYINFYGLRQHAKQENNLPVTEIIYIHSKLMIVDDEIALIGSANINDRSLNGDRDSELTIIVQDQMLIDSYMNQQQVKIPKFAHTLRVNLYSEHFGLESEEVQDPLCPLLEKEIKVRTSVNTKMYKEIFACYPDDKIKTLADYASFKEGKKLELYDQYSAFIKGHAVEFPLQFLCDENLKGRIYIMEQVAGQICYT